MFSLQENKFLINCWFFFFKQHYWYLFLIYLLLAINVRVSQNDKEGNLVQHGSLIHKFGWIHACISLDSHSNMSVAIDQQKLAMTIDINKTTNYQEVESLPRKFILKTISINWNLDKSSFPEMFTMFNIFTRNYQIHKKHLLIL